MSKTVRSIQSWRLPLLTATLLCSLNPLRAEAAATQPETSLTNSTSTFSSPALRPEPILETFRGTEQRVNLHPALSRFFASHGTDWEIRWDRSSDRPHLIQGAGIALLPVVGTGNLETLVAPGVSQGKAGKLKTIDAMEAAARQFLAKTSDLLQVDPKDLAFDRSRSFATDPERQLWFLEFQQVHSGIPVDGARVFLRINHGRVVQFGTDQFFDVSVQLEPSILREEALPRALEALALAPEELTIKTAPELKIFPAAAGLSLAWMPDLEARTHLLGWEWTAVRAPGSAEATVLRIRLDAHSGELLEVTDLQVFGQARGQVHEASGGLALAVPLPHLLVQHQGIRQTNEAGYFEYLGGEATAGLEGTLITVTDDCGATSLSSWNGILDFGGSTGTDCGNPVDGGPGNTQAARDAYFYLTKGYLEVSQRYPWLNLPAPLTAWTNQPQLQCEASWSESEGSFYFSRANQECTNIAEVPGILLHEVGHAADSVLGGAAADGASGEAQADFFAFLQTDDACIGRGLRPGSPCENCGPGCTGVRDLAPFTGGGAAPIASPANLETPDGLHCDRFACPFQGSTAVRGPLGYQAHCESQIASSALLDLDQKLADRKGSVNGRIAMEELWFAALPALGAAYRLVNPGQMCVAENAAVDGCGASNWYSVLLAADDDDGNLANGTPNGCLIWDAFNAHGIACGASPACFCKGGGSLANAGPDVTLCQGGEALLGTLGGSHRDYLWQPGGQTTPQILVSPSQTTEYTLTATDSCGQTRDTAMVNVVACDGFEENFENGSAGWMTSGLWHAVDDTSCASPPASTGTGAMYYGDDQTCVVETGGPNRGDLVSPPIQIAPGTETLSFDFFLAGVNRQALGRAEVSIKAEGGETWQPRWAMEISEVTGDAWQTSPSISLASFRGETIRIRFHFETYGLTEESGHYLGWLIDNVRVFEGPDPGNGTDPMVTVLEAPDGPLSKCDCVKCLFQAIDSQGRDISEIFSWSSDLDGVVGTGSRSALILSPGDHVLTGTVTDYDGRSASRSVPVRIIEDPANCGLADWPPAEVRLHCGDYEDE
ncbi:MAG: hypothetical protein K0U98_09435 [Deltaproteobacteria bacterium]|nr:hypothetical protein [Deltaproteobacteria bacterium]